MAPSAHNPRIAIRADASAEMGTGHIRRCHSLARVLEANGAEIRLFARDLGVDTAALLSPPLALHELPAPPPSGTTSFAKDDPPHLAWARVSQERDAADTLAAIDAAGWVPDIVIVDHYAFDTRWHDAVRARTGATIAAIDDLGDRSLAADLVIDHNWNDDFHHKYAGRLGQDTELLAGPGFALLDPLYAAAPRYRPRDTVGSIGIFMGGSDAANSAARVLDAIDAIAFDGVVEVASTSANPNLDALRTRLARRPHAKLSIDLPDLASFFARHDLHIGAGGGATWERFCIGAPSILLSFALNHAQVLLPLRQLGLAEVLPLGWDQGNLVAAIEKLVSDPSLRCDFSRRGQLLVDGEGCQRVAAAMLEGDIPVLVRRAAGSDDARRIFDWRNDPYVRSVSRDSGEIAFDAHLAWFERIIASPDHLLLIAEKGGVPIGVVRFDRQDALRHEISLFLNPLLAGRGLGLPMIRAAQRQLRREIGHDLVILAETLPDNAASQRLFQKAGYSQSGCHFELRLGAEP